MKTPASGRLASATVLFLAALVASTGRTIARDLSFEDRVKAQEAIERVYYSHQIGATRPFVEAVPRARLESKVRTYLKETVALERYWRTAVTAEMLARELQRMASGSRMPDRLRELEAALGDDPLLIQETLARPALVDRLIRNFFASDATIHGTERREAEALREDLARGRIDPWSEHPRRSVVEVARVDEVAGANGAGARGLAGGKNDPARLELRPDDFERYRARLASGHGEVEPVQEEREAYAVRVPLTKEEDRLRVAIFSVPKRPWAEWWASVENALQESSVGTVARVDLSLPIIQTGRPEILSDSTCLTDDTWDSRTLDGLPGPRASHTAVWTGSVMVVWGGTNGVALNTGSRYDPATDTWSATSTVNAPQGRYHHTAVWTGTLMVVWGGHSGINFSENLGSGGRYDPTADTWTPISTVNAPVSRMAHSAVWTGSRMIVWGGHFLRHESPEAQIHIVTYYLNDGGQYDPATDRWNSISTTNAPQARSSHTAVWSGQLMVVWGGASNNYRGDPTGGRYDPASDTWSSTSMINVPSGRFIQAIWTGTRMIIWGGTNDATGGRYDPVTDTWASISTIGAPATGSVQPAVWTGSQMIVWGRMSTNGYQYFNTGARYDPAADTWASMSTADAPMARVGQTAVWTGSRMIIWGGVSDPNSLGVYSSYLNTGGRYDPVSDTWASTFTSLAPWGRSGYSVTWTGSSIFVWGGYDLLGGMIPTDSGVRYDPAIDTWSAISTLGAPSARYRHSAVWTGSLIVVWGGYGGGVPLNTGGRYDPAADIWTAVSSIDAPSGLHTQAVWTGSRMIVWGGYNGGADLHTGGRYDPVTDAWSPVSTMNSPPGRDPQSMVWTGSRMIVWGGGGSQGLAVKSGGRYDPVNDIWTTMSTVNAPSAHSSPSAVWTGSRLIVWGGMDNNFYLDNSGGLYDPASDTWTSTSHAFAPSSRMGQTAVWTGRLMLIWGGTPVPFSSLVAPQGARYDPLADSWAAISAVNEPPLAGTAVWTGREMIVLNYTGGARYCSCTSMPFYRDRDGDGHGDRNDSILACAQPAGYANNNDDCDDGDPSIHPGAAEVCNGRDDDCDTVVDDEPGASASCDDGDACTIDACRSGSCVRTEAIIPQAICTAEPAVLNLDSKGREFGVTVGLTNLCPGTSLDPAMLAPFHLAALASPSLGTVTLPVPESGPACAQDGIWETASAREPLGPASMRVSFLARSDGLCSTLDGNRQDIIALLKGVPDRESMRIFLASSYPGVKIPVRCGLTVTVLSQDAKAGGRIASPIALSATTPAQGQP